MISLTESETAFTVVIPGEQEQAVAVNGGPAEAISGQNQAGTPVGAVTWQAGGLTFAVQASDTDGLSVVPLANTVR